ncbi:MAG: ARMT1-like domain-containing protein [Desulfobacterota bacterium]|nr:ARMT1-like domain-containing protein [Thermodesulfobacteriota bacterium]MDW8001407.1 ARMT1-like domain-containing protein [Deltaproteobacteria bacterium]
MKVGDSCFPCILGLARRTLELIGVDGSDIEEFEDLIRREWGSERTPPSIANLVLHAISAKYGVEDPYASIKLREIELAKDVSSRLKSRLSHDLFWVLKFSALGNSSDFFIEPEYNWEEMDFFADMDRIENELVKRKDVLMLGDNVSDFFFDLPLIDLLEKMGKTVYYVVRERPVQNDLSMRDVERYGLYEFFNRFLSTDTGEVGLKESDLKGQLKDLFEGETFVISKGMGNYETLTEFSRRPVLYIMKIKCREVMRSTGYPMGKYVAIYREG